MVVACLLVIFVVPYLPALSATHEVISEQTLHIAS
jgi:hypothetical protein